MALVCGGCALSALAGEAPAQAGFSRKLLREQDISVPGRRAAVALIEFAPGGYAARHSHPGEEIGYVIEGTFTLEIDGKEPQALKAGDTFIIPPGVVHTGRNKGETPVKVVSTYVIEKGQPLATPAK